MDLDKQPSLNEKLLTPEEDSSKTLAAYIASFSPRKCFKTISDPFDSTAEEAKLVENMCKESKEVTDVAGLLKDKF
jgi:hypothetical protein